MAAEMASRADSPAQSPKLSKAQGSGLSTEEEEAILKEGYEEMDAEAQRPLGVLVWPEEALPSPLRPYSKAVQALDASTFQRRLQVEVTNQWTITDGEPAALQVVFVHRGRVFAPEGLQGPFSQPLVFILPDGRERWPGEAYLLPDSPDEFAAKLSAVLRDWDGEEKVRLGRMFQVFTGPGPAKAKPRTKPKLLDRVLRRESFLAEVESDQPAKKDLLGFTPYVEALARFLAAKGTQPPLTVSIEGEWGSGKSSFMLQLEDELVRQDELQDERGRVFVVRFNPWRYDRGESLWAAFALHFIGSLEAELTRWERFQARLALGWNRSGRGSRPVSRKDAGAALAWLAGGLAVALAVPAAGALLLPAGLLSSAVGAVGAVSGLSVAAFQGSKAVVNAVGRVRRRLQKEIRSPDYAERAAFIEQVHTDLKHIVEAYVTAPRIFVFVEDLDRCDVPRAAELMQAINLLIADDPRIVFLLGMDREKVAAGIAVKHRDLLPFMEVAPEGPALRGAGLVYGYTFIEKFIQVPFAVPVPTEAEIGRMLRRGKPAPANEAGSNGSTAPTVNAPAPANGRNGTNGQAGRDGAMGAVAPRPEGAPADPAAQERRSDIEVGFEADSAAVLALAVQLAPVFGNNPRRVKQFVNLFRLRGLIATRTGLFDVPPGQEAGLTLEQLGKFVALSIRFPLLLEDLDAHPGLLADLQERALGATRRNGSNGALRKDRKDSKRRVEALARWSAEPDLVRLLAVGHGGKGGKASPGHDMGLVDVRRLLRVSPAVAVEAAAAKAPGGTTRDLPPDGARLVYRAQLERLLREGPLGSKEEAFLAGLRRELPLGEDEAAAVRAEVEDALAPNAPKRVKSAA